MLKIKNISKILAVGLVIAGFIAGSLPLEAQSSSCCNTTNSCCCNTLEEESNSMQSSGFNTKCCCAMEESQPPASLVLKAWEETRPQNNIERAVYLPLFRISPAVLNSKTTIKSETIRNSGPPIFIFLSFLLI